jgi:hypothetical protein
MQKKTKAVQSRTKKQCTGGALRGPCVVQSDSRQYNAIQNGNARAVHSKDPARCKAIQGGATSYKKAVRERCTPGTLGGAKAIQRSARPYTKAVHGRCTPRPCALQSDRRQCNSVQKGSAWVVHCKETAPCKSDLMQCNIVQKRHVPERCTIRKTGCKRTQDSATWYNKAVHYGALSGYCAVQKRPKAVQPGHERQCKRKVCPNLLT